MLIVVTGVSGSGKSEYAEQICCKLSGDRKKYYIATMQPYGEEGKKRILRHHRLLSGKGFETIEQHKDIAEVIPVITEADRSGMKAVLIECISNLVANEMFADDVDNKTDTADKILSEIKQVAEVVDELVIVTNNVAEDGIDYDSTTLEYIRTISDVNIGLSQMADKVAEVVVGIPIIVKEERTCQ